jgi:hypothetical protein
MQLSHKEELLLKCQKSSLNGPKEELLRTRTRQMKQVTQSHLISDLRSISNGINEIIFYYLIRTSLMIYFSNESITSEIIDIAVKCLILIRETIKIWNDTSTRFPYFERLLARGYNELVNFSPKYFSLTTSWLRWHYWMSSIFSSDTRIKILTSKSLFLSSFIKWLQDSINALIFQLRFWVRSSWQQVIIKLSFMTNFKISSSKIFKPQRILWKKSTTN